MSGRRQRSDSATAAVGLMQSATAGELEPPTHISVPEAARPFWFGIIRARPREDWLAAPALMNAAANLAWTQWQIDKCRRQIDGEADIEDNTSVAQLGSLLLKMQRLEMGYLRVLQQHSRAVQGEARDVAKRQGIAEQVRGDNPLGDDLIARPTVQ